MQHEHAPDQGAEAGPAWAASKWLACYSLAAPTEAAARSIASALARRGHRYVTVRPLYLPHLDPDSPLFGMAQFSRPELEGWWSVRSLVDEEAPGPDAEFHQQECEQVEVDAVGRENGGFRDVGSVTGRETMLAGWDPAGTTHELDQPRAHRLRREAVSRFPPPAEEPAPAEPLAYAAADRPFPPLLESVRQVARALAAREGELPDGVAWWLTAPAEEFPDDPSVLFGLADSTLHQGTCYPHTAGNIPLLAGLAAYKDVRPAHRAVLISFLYEAATVGRRLAASEADRRVALGLPFEETPDEHAARRAVDVAAPPLLDRWDSADEAGRYALATLAAATGHSASRPRVLRLARRWATGPRSHALRLAAALAGGDDTEAAAALREVVASGGVGPLAAPSPLADTRGGALTVLSSLAEQEMPALWTA
ncbi:hypothetical protein ACPCDX_10355 [Streptomyces koyangensis]|uniref:hypothetical protein n=1 Tax=Streptomyces koyangensis TaxID=188770 RepID=UPI003C2FDB52